MRNGSLYSRNFASRACSKGRSHSIGDFRDRHVIESEHLNARALTGAVERTDHLGIRSAKLRHLVAGDVASLRHVETKVPSGDDDSGATFTDEWLGQAELPLNPLELRACFVRTKDERDPFVRDTVQRVSRGCTAGHGLGGEQRVVQIGEDQNLRNRWHVNPDTPSARLPVTSVSSHPVEPVFSTQKSWRGGKDRVGRDKMPVWWSVSTSGGRRSGRRCCSDSG